MIARRWIPHKDYDTICLWCDARRIARPPFKALPSAGFIVDDTVVGFLYHDPSASVGFFESVLSNPRAKRKDIYNGVKLITEKMLYEAKVMDIQIIQSVTNLSGIEKIAKRLGFKEVKCKMKLLARGIL